LFERSSLGVVPGQALSHRQEQSGRSFLYLIDTTDYIPATCTTGVISSATVQQITQVTNYLKTKSKTLHPFKIDGLNK
jgi:hypothetical protein